MGVLCQSSITEDTETIKKEEEKPRLPVLLVFAMVMFATAMTMDIERSPSDDEAEGPQSRLSAEEKCPDICLTVYGCNRKSNAFYCCVKRMMCQGCIGNCAEYKMHREKKQ